MVRMARGMATDACAFVVSRVCASSFVPRLEVVVDDLLLLFVEVLESGEDLGDDGTGFAFREGLLHLEVHIQVASITMLQNGTECIRVDREHVVESHHLRVLE